MGAERGKCWPSSVREFGSRVLRNPQSDALYFVSLLIPAEDKRRISEHFAVEDGGVIIDHAIVFLSGERRDLPCDMYYSILKDNAMRLGLRPYNPDPIRLSPKQFTLFKDILPVSKEVRPAEWGLATIRRCAAALLQVWSEGETDEKMAADVIFRVHAIRVVLGSKRPPLAPAGCSAR